MGHQTRHQKGDKPLVSAKFGEGIERGAPKEDEEDRPPDISIPTLVQMPVSSISVNRLDLQEEEESGFGGLSS